MLAACFSPSSADQWQPTEYIKILRSEKKHTITNYKNNRASQA
jgi:hypothetical protein